MMSHYDLHVHIHIHIAHRYVLVGEGEGEADIDVINTITYYILPIDFRLIAYRLPIDCPGPWVPGPYPLWLNLYASRAISGQSIGNRESINRKSNKQYITGNIAYYMSCL